MTGSVLEKTKRKTRISQEKEQMDMDPFMSDERIEKIRIAVSERLSPKKYEHSINVAQYAGRIAAKHQSTLKKCISPVCCMTLPAG